MQYTCLDLMYDVNCIYIYAASSSAPAFQGTKYLIRYLYGFPHCTIIYPYDLGGTTTHIWELPVKYPIFTMVMVIHHYVERIWRIIDIPNFLYNIYDHEKILSR